MARALRGKTVPDALKLVEFSERKAAFYIGKTLKSAIANAENMPNCRRYSVRARGGDRTGAGDETVLAARPRHGQSHQGAGPVTKDNIERIRNRVQNKPLCLRKGDHLGQKVNPIGFRVTVNKDWRSRWFAEKKEFGDLLHEDLKIRDLVKARLKDAAVPEVLIERYANRARVTVFTARPGIVIGRKGQDIERLREEIAAKTKKEIYLEIREVKDPDTNAQLIAENISLQLERRVSFRRAMNGPSRWPWNWARWDQNPGERPAGRRGAGPARMVQGGQGAPPYAA
jgi:hypothetical protein